jgi:hypothetical protein
MKQNFFDNYKVDSLLLIFFFILPSLLYANGYIQSYSAALIIVIFFYLLIFTLIREKKKINIKFLSLSILISIIIYIHQIFVTFLIDSNFSNKNTQIQEKIFISYLSIIIFFYSIFFFNKFLIKKKFNQIYFYKLMKILFLIMFILSFFILLRFNKFFFYYTYDTNNLPIFLNLFLEPSHFITGFFSIYFLFLIFNPRYRVIFLTIGLFLSLMLPSLTFLCGIFLIVLLFYSILRVVLFIIPLIIFFIFFLYNFNIELLNYFYSRINFIEAINNCSSYFVLNSKINYDQISTKICNINFSLLYYFKSIHEMYLNLVNYPFGVGFQNFGAIGMESLFRKVITLRSGAFGADSSLISSFLLSKLISEFGVFGIIFLFYYFKFFIESFIFFKFRHNLFLIQKKYLEIFYHISILSFSIEIFVRGFGYFTIGSFLFILSVLGLKYKKQI